jgi:hypothetical protein
MRSRAALIGMLLIARPATAQQISAQMRDGIPNASFVAPYSSSERAKAAQNILKSATPPTLTATISLTPNAPYENGGAHLSFWKPSFVLGTSSGGEAGVNFWGIHNQGHVNVGFTPAPMKSTLVDCRLLSARPITYKVYSGAGAAPSAAGEITLEHGHFLLAVPGSGSGGPVSVELWPTPDTTTMGFLGCELNTIEQR